MPEELQHSHLPLACPACDKRDARLKELEAMTTPFTEHVRRFLGAESRRDAVTAFIRAEKAMGIEKPDRGRAAAIVRRHGHGLAVVNAMVGASSRSIDGNRYDYMEGTLGNGKNVRRDARPSDAGADDGSSARESW